MPGSPWPWVKWERVFGDVGGPRIRKLLVFGWCAVWGVVRALPAEPLSTDDYCEGEMVEDA